MAHAFEDGIWSVIDDKVTDFTRTKNRLGFLSWVEVYCPMGAVTVYSRSGTDLPKFKYDFVFVFNMGLGTEYRVWVPTLPDLFLFLKVIGAHAHDSELVEYLRTTDFREAMNLINTLFSEISMGEALKVEIRNLPRE
jgi:hypothetical protein